MRLIVTGSNGFIGSSICTVAQRHGHEVLGISRGSSPVEGSAGAYLQADVATTDLSPVFREFRPDAIVHASGCASVASSIAEPLEDFKGSVVPWANILEAVRKSGERPLIFFTSSAAAYGQGTAEPLREDSLPKPISPYGFHKQLCETIGREYGECYGLAGVSLRLFSIFGPRQRRLLLWDISQKLKGTSDTLVLDGTGEETRDYLFVDDLADAILKLAEVLPRSAGFRILNLARGSSTSIRDLGEMVLSLTDSSKTLSFSGHTRPGDPQKWSADISALREYLPNWQPSDLRPSLGECLDHWHK